MRKILLHHRSDGRLRDTTRTQSSIIVERYHHAQRQLFQTLQRPVHGEYSVWMRLRLIGDHNGGCANLRQPLAQYNTYKTKTKEAVNSSPKTNQEKGSTLFF